MLITLLPTGAPNAEKQEECTEQQQRQSQNSTSYRETVANPPS